MATECIPTTVQAAEPPTSRTTRRLPRNLSAEDGRISGMIGVEAHLWAPQEYELTMVEIWLQAVDAFRSGYIAYRPWPAAMDQVRPAYMFMTWMEWIYCSYTLLHDEASAIALEQHVVEQCERLVPPAPWQGS